MMSTFSKNLKRFRLAKNLTQEQAAEALKVSAQTISRWECETTMPDVAMLPNIARLYCVSIDDLYRENSVAYDNYAQRLGAVYESTRDPQDFIRADVEYRKLMRDGQHTAEDLRLYGILHQYMMVYCRDKAGSLFEQVLNGERGTEIYWRTKRQKIFLDIQNGKAEEAISRQLQAVEEHENDIDEWICLIAAYHYSGQLQKAESQICLALQRFPQNACLCVYCGDVYAGLKQYDDAFRYWQKALELDDSFVDALYSMGFCYEEIGEYEKAFHLWERLAQRMEGKGFDIEANYPRKLAQMCARKIKS